MKRDRRSFVVSVLASLLAWKPLAGLAKASAAVENPAGDGLAAVMRRELQGQTPQDSDRVSLIVPDIAEDGAIVPIEVASELPDVSGIWVFVEKNPNPLAAAFALDESLAAYVSLRVKMNESCDVIAAVKSGSEYFGARKRVRVSVGGCG